MKDLLAALAIEVELREEFQPIHQSTRIFQSATRTESHRRTEGPAFYTWQQQSCAFCLGSHAHEDCGKITNVRERKRLVSKFGRCFNCIRKGHRARECRTNVSCKKCKGRHPTSSLCEIETREGREIGINEAVTTSHVGTGNRVALQTAQAVVKGSRGGRVRVLFDSASHKSFITSRTVSSLGLDPLKREWLAVNTFGKKASNSQLRDVVSVEMTAVGGGKAIQIEAFVVPEISRIQNEHLEAAKRDFPHLKGIWLSDVCRHKEELEIDLLVGADYLWRFQTGRTIRGEPDEPVAVETALGWVLSGPLKGRKIDKEQEVQVNFVTAESLVTDSLERDVHKLWDLETIGIRESNEVHEEFVDNISFNGQRYSVKLPWKAGNDRLPSNYENSLSRMRSQVRKLRKEPGVLDEYDAVIKEQLATGIIERVAELEKEEKVHYIPHLGSYPKRGKHDETKNRLRRIVQ